MILSCLLYSVCCRGDLIKIAGINSSSYEMKKKFFKLIPSRCNIIILFERILYMKNNLRSIINKIKNI